VCARKRIGDYLARIWTTVLWHVFTQCVEHFWDMTDVTDTDTLPVDVLRESGKGNTSVVVVEHVNVRVEYKRVARASILRQNYNIRVAITSLHCTQPSCRRGGWVPHAADRQKIYRLLSRPIAYTNWAIDMHLCGWIVVVPHYAVVLIGRITCGSCPFVCPSVRLVWASNSKTESAENLKLSQTFPETGVTGVSVFSSHGQVTIS